MSIRIALLCFFVVAAAVYAWKNWFVSLCALIVLTAFMGHPDMPRTLLGIQGLNPWNLLLFAIVVPWYLERRRRGVKFDLPRSGRVLLPIFVIATVVAYARAALDIDSFPTDAEEGGGKITFAGFTGEYLVNSLKFIVPGILLYDACRTRRRVVIALCIALLMAAVYSSTIVKTIPLSGLQATGKAEMKQRSRIGEELGFHANSAAMICATGFWAMLALATFWRGKVRMVIPISGALLAALALALTRSRGGYMACIGIGVIFAVFLWRVLLVLLPIGLVAVVCAFPGVADRALAGVGIADVSGDSAHDVDVITAGRATNIWPPVIEQITHSPLFGYGRLAILRTEAHDEVKALTGEPTCPTHPHNAYLELLLDGGALTAIPVLWLYLGLFFVSLKLARDRQEALCRVTGACALAAVTALLVMGLSGQTFFPKENAQMAWCLYGIALRVWVERKKSLADVGSSVREAAPVRISVGVRQPELVNAS